MMLRSLTKRATLIYFYIENYSPSPGLEEKEFKLRVLERGPKDRLLIGFGVEGNSRIRKAGLSFLDQYTRFIG